MTKTLRRYFLRKWLQRRYANVSQMVVNAQRFHKQHDNAVSQRSLDMWSAQEAMLKSIMENGS